MDYAGDLAITQERRAILKNRKLLRNVYIKWYDLLLGDIEADKLNYAVVELGTGAGFIKELYPYVICTDILPVTGIDLVCDCLHLPFKDKTIQRFIMIDVFHHVVCSESFLRELERCLVDGGSIVMIEPACTPWGRFIWKNFHHEDFDPEKSDWKISGDSPLSSANGAMPWIVFCRDRELFLQKFPTLKIENYSTNTPLSYLLSGGFSYSQIVPSILIRPLIYFENLLLKVSGKFGMFSLIKLIKQNSG